MESPPAALADLPLRELLAQLAAVTPAPGGGSAIAVACSLAAGLVEMAAGFGPAQDDLTARVTPDATGARAGELRRRALELAEAELDAYAPVLEALRLSPQDPERGERVRAARSRASATPLEIAAVAAELAQLGAQTAQAVRPQLAGDAVAAVLLAEGACRAAAELVSINLSDVPGDPQAVRAGELARDAARFRMHAIG